MNKIATLLCLSLLAASCADTEHALTGVVRIYAGQSFQPDSGTAVRLHHVQDSAKIFQAISDSVGAYRIDDLPAGQYLRVANSYSGKQSPMDFLRELVMVSKELQSMTGYDAISNMPDELKAAIAFDDDKQGSDTSARRAAQLLHVDSVAREFIANLPASMHRIFPAAGERATVMQILDIDGIQPSKDEIVFE